MSELRVYPEDGPQPRLVLDTFSDIRRELGAIGVNFERWKADRILPDGANPEDVIAAYRGDIDRLMTDYGFKSVDVVRMTPDHPDRDALRAKFLDEHTHTEFEVRFFVEGSGLFCLHTNEQVYAVICKQGDLISVPAGTTHWFDMGPRPRFTAIRLFTNPDGWVANFTGSDIASRFPRYE